MNGIFNVFLNILIYPEQKMTIINGNIEIAV